MVRKVQRVVEEARRDREDRMAFGIAMMVFAVGALIGLAVAATK